MYNSVKEFFEGSKASCKGTVCINCNLYGLCQQRGIHGIKKYNSLKKTCKDIIKRLYVIYLTKS